MTTLRPLGVGSKVLTHGDRMAGFYGEVTGILTADELRTLVGVTQGTAMQTGDIVWLKFNHNYKTLYISKQPIQHSISWDYLQSLDLVFGKMVEINKKVYLLRLMQGANISPASASGGYNSEWDNLIVRVVNEWSVYNNSDVNSTFTICQEVSNSGINFRILRGYNSIDFVGAGTSNAIYAHYGWRPVLELLYEK